MRGPGESKPAPRGWHCPICREHTVLDRVVHLVVQHGWAWPSQHALGEEMAGDIVREGQERLGEEMAEEAELIFRWVTERQNQECLGEQLAEDIDPGARAWKAQEYAERSRARREIHERAKAFAW